MHLYDAEFMQRWHLAMHLVDAVFYAEVGRVVTAESSSRATQILETLRRVLEEGYAAMALQRVPHIVLLNPAWYHEQMKPVMAEWVILWMEQNHFKGLDHSELILAILEGVTSSKNPALAQKIRKECSPKSVKMLTLVNQWLTSYLPHCLQKIDRVSFGIMTEADKKLARSLDPRMPKTREKLAIPFVGKWMSSTNSTDYL